MYDGRIRVPVRGATQNLVQFDRVLTHELTHAVVTSLAPRGVPIWLHEGLAQYFSGADPDAAERRLRAWGMFFPLADLQGSFSGLNETEAVLAYDESLMAVRVLVERTGTGLGLLLQDLGEGQTFEQAVQRFGFTCERFEADLLHRLRASER